MPTLARVRDDRGQLVPLVPASAHPGISLDPRISRRAAAAGAGPLRPSVEELRQGFGMALLVLPILLAFSFAPVLLFVFKYISVWWMAGTVLALGVVEWFILLGVARRLQARREALVHVAAGLCGSCGQALKGLLPESDGCTVCPECGAAWRAVAP